jgi:FlaA1/EpsC-like NDP-sugar epimerase
MNPQLKNPKFYLMILTDVFVFIVALFLSYLIRFEFSFAQIDIKQIYGLLLWMVPLSLLFFFLSGYTAVCGVTPACGTSGC